MTPQVRPLSSRHRTVAFILSILLFVTLVPLLVFYAVGYRFDFTDKLHNIKSVGGLYISSEAPDTAIYLDNKPVENMRIFQRAAYIQNVNEGVHEVHVQGAGVTTWVKQLPVFAHFVTEAASFNMPLVPQVRPITQYQTATGTAVVWPDSQLANILQSASTTATYFVASSTKATSTYVANTEYTYVKGLFASTTVDRTILAETAARQAEPFSFSDSTVYPTTTATSTVVLHDMELHRAGDDVYAEWLGAPDKTPYYFCVMPDEASTTAALYGPQVAAQVIGVDLSGTTTSSTYRANDRICRRQIRIDRKGQDVKWFDFVPGNRDLVLMHLADGVYVVEIDDRSWQNTQLLYPGKDLTMLVDGNTIYVKDGTAYLELYTELQN